jgi:hypothetical protein
MKGRLRKVADEESNQEQHTELPDAHRHTKLLETNDNEVS